MSGFVVRQSNFPEMTQPDPRAAFPMRAAALGALKKESTTMPRVALEERAARPSVDRRRAQGENDRATW
jgi:hypothetical protein